MKHLVFILGSYYPKFSGVGKCAHQVIELLKRDYKITVIAIQNDISLLAHEEHSGIDIFRVSNSEIENRNLLEKKIKTLNGIKDKILLNMSRARSALSKVFARESTDARLVTSYVNKLHELDAPIDVIIPLVFPFESVIAALKYKKSKPATDIIPYLFDDFVESASLHVFKLNSILKSFRHIELEAIMLKNSTAILAMHPLERHFKKSFGNLADDKIVFLEHPLLAERNNVHAPEDGSIKLTFAGSLIKKIREPSYLLKLIDCLNIDQPIEINLYIMGNCSVEINKYVSKGNIRLKNHGHVLSETASAAIDSCDILLNIGEMRGRQISSKIFEYMSSGKPIIHLSYVEDDVVATILKKYPLALCILQKDSLLHENCKSVGDFIMGNKCSKLHFNDVAEIFPEAIPETTANIFRKFINNV